MWNNVTKHHLQLVNEIKIEYDAIRLVVGEALYFSKDGVDIAYIKCPEIVTKGDTLTVEKMQGTIPFTLSEN